MAQASALGTVEMSPNRVISTINAALGTTGFTNSTASGMMEKRLPYQYNLFFPTFFVKNGIARLDSTPVMVSATEVMGTKSTLPRTYLK